MLWFCQCFAFRLIQLLRKMEMENFSCSVCCANEKKKQRKFDTVDGLRSHITTVHCPWIPFECALCPMVFVPTETVLKQHYQQTHPDDVPKAVYTYEEDKKREVKRILTDSLRVVIARKQQLMISNSQTITVAPQEPSCDIEITSPAAEITAKVTTETEKSETDKEVPSETNIPTAPAVAEVMEVTDNSSDVFTKTVANTKLNHSQEHDNSSLDIEFIPTIEEKKTTENIPAIETQIPAILKDREQTCTLKSEPKTNHLKAGSAGVLKRRYEVILEEQEEYHGFSPPAKQGRKHVWCYICSKWITGQKTTDHIWRQHMTRKRVHCIRCDYKAYQACDIKKHQKVTGHSWIDNTQLLHHEYKAASVNAFGTRNNNDNDRECGRSMRPVELRDDGMETQCKLCGEWTINKVKHVRLTHLPPVYRCQIEKCHFRLYEWNESEAKHHLATGHPGVVKLVAKWNLDLANKNGQYADVMRKAFA